MRLGNSKTSKPKLVFFACFVVGLLFFFGVINLSLVIAQLSGLMKFHHGAPRTPASLPIQPQNVVESFEGERGGIEFVETDKSLPKNSITSAKLLHVEKKGHNHDNKNDKSQNNEVSMTSYRGEGHKSQLSLRKNAKLGSTGQVGLAKNGTKIDDQILSLLRIPLLGPMRRLDSQTPYKSPTYLFNASAAEYLSASLGTPLRSLQQIRPSRKSSSYAHTVFQKYRHLVSREDHIRLISALEGSKHGESSSWSYRSAFITEYDLKTILPGQVEGDDNEVGGMNATFGFVEIQALALKTHLTFNAADSSGRVHPMFSFYCVLCKQPAPGKILSDENCLLVKPHPKLLMNKPFPTRNYTNMFHMCPIEQLIQGGFPDLAALVHINSSSVEKVHTSPGRLGRQLLSELVASDRFVPIYRTRRDEGNATSSTPSIQHNNLLHHKITVCTGPVYGHFQEMPRLIEWVEFLFQMGVSKVVIYVTSVVQRPDLSGGTIDEVFFLSERFLFQALYYQEYLRSAAAQSDPRYQGRSVEVIVWESVGFYESHYFDQQGMIDHCFKSQARYSDIVTVQDIDEFLIPAQTSPGFETWLDLIDRYMPKRDRVVRFMSKWILANCLKFSSRPELQQYGIHSTLNYTLIDKVFMPERVMTDHGEKYFLDPRALVLGAVHNVLSVYLSIPTHDFDYPKQDRVPLSQAVIIHYTKHFTIEASDCRLHGGTPFQDVDPVEEIRRKRGSFQSSSSDFYYDANDVSLLSYFASILHRIAERFNHLSHFFAAE